MSRPSLALSAVLLGSVLAASGTFGQQLFLRRSTDSAPTEKNDGTPLDPMAAARGVYHMLRNGLDFLSYGEYERALALLREAETRQAELNPADQKRLKKAIAEAQQGLREGANTRRRPLARNRSAPRPGSIAALPAEPAPAQKVVERPEPQAVPAAGGEPVQLVGATLAEPAIPTRPSPATTGADLGSGQPGPALEPAGSEPAVGSPAPAAAVALNERPASPPSPARPEPIMPIAPILPMDPPAPPPGAVPAPAAVPLRDPLPPSLRIPDPGTSQPRAVQAPAPAPEPIALVSGPPADRPEPTPPPLPSHLPVLSNEPAAPTASEPPQPLVVEPAPAASASTPEPMPEHPALNPPVVPPAASPGLSADVPSQPAEVRPASARHESAAAPSELPTEPPPAAPPTELEDLGPPPAEAAPVDQPNAEPARTTLPPSTVEAAVPDPAASALEPSPRRVEPPSSAPVRAATVAPLGGRFPLPPVESVQSTLPPELRREVERIAQRQEAEDNARRQQAPIGPQAEPLVEMEQPTTRLELPRAPSPTEARPIRAIAVPDEFVPLAARSWEPTRKYWAAAATCHSPLYFQDASLERYGHSVEQFFGPNGRFLTYPIDDPTQSMQRNQIAQPFFSAGLMAFQILALPYNLVMDPPWEAEYDLGYWRPGDRIPPDLYYLPWTGVGPPLRGMKY